MRYLITGGSGYIGGRLTDDYHGVSTVRGEVLSDAAQQQRYVPAP